jgi:hypothetical protein
MSASAAHESRRRLVLPRVGEELAEGLAIRPGKGDADRRQPLPPPHLLAGIGRALDGRQDPAFIEHHVHPIVVPQRREDLPADAKRRTPVMIQLDGFGQRERKGAGLICRDGHRAKISGQLLPPPNAGTPEQRCTRGSVHHGAMEAEPGLSRAEMKALLADHASRIAEAVPEGSTSVSGSALLGRFGGHDLDLVVLVPDVARAASRLRQIYPPLYEGEWRDDWAAFRHPGPPQVDVVLTKRGTKGDAHHRRVWELILADEALRAEYERLQAAGMSGAQKAAFFDRVVAMLRDAAVPGS